MLYGITESVRMRFCWWLGFLWNTSIDVPTTSSARIGIRCSIWRRVSTELGLA